MFVRMGSEHTRDYIRTQALTLIDEPVCAVLRYTDEAWAGLLSLTSGYRS